MEYEVVSKISRTAATIYTAVVVAWSTGPTGQTVNYGFYCESFVTTAWKRAKTSPLTLARTDLDASPWQRPVSYFRPHPAVSGEIQNGCHPPPTVFPWFRTLRLLLLLFPSLPLPFLLPPLPIPFILLLPLLLLVLLLRYNSDRVFAFSTMYCHLRQFWASSLHFIIFILLK
jgi:hypothetical protein